MKAWMSVTDERSPRLPAFATYLLLALAVAGVFWRVLSHPGEVLYSGHSDILAQHYPFRHLMVDSLRMRQRLPTWNPTAFSGMPLVGDPQAGLYYPPNWLHALVPADDCYTVFGYVVLLHVLIAGWGMLWWLRGLGFGSLAGLTGAFAFALSGKWILHLVVPGHIVFAAIAWLPWLFGLTDRMATTPTGEVTEKQRSAPLPSAVFLGLVLGMMIVGCHPQLLFYGMLLFLGYAILIGCAARNWPFFGWLGLAGIIAALVSAVYWLPILDSLEYFVRGGGLPYEEAARRSLGLSDFASLLVPSIGPTRMWESIAYAGVAPLALALFALLRPKSIRCWFLTAFAFLCFWFAMGEHGGLHRFLHDWVPGFHLFRIPPRILLLLGLPVGYLAASAVQHLATSHRTGLGIVASFLLLLVATLPALELFSRRLAASFELVADWPPESHFVVPLIALLSIALPRLFWRGPVPQIVVAVFPLLVAGELAFFAVAQIKTAPLKEAIGEHPLVEQLRGPLGRFRILSMNQKGMAQFHSLPVSYCTPARIESLRGFNPLIPRSTFRYLWAGVGQQPMEWPYGKTGIPNFPIQSKKHLDLLNVRWIITDSPLSLPGLVERQVIRDLEVYMYMLPHGGLVNMLITHVYENERAFPRAALIPAAKPAPAVEESSVPIPDDARAEVFIEGLEREERSAGFTPINVDHSGDEIRLDVAADQPAWVFLSEMWYPGWQATVDGRPVQVHRANSVFMALRVAAGTHQVRLVYKPRSYVIGAWLSVVSVLACLGYCGLRRTFLFRRGQ